MPTQVQTLVTKKIDWLYGFGLTFVLLGALVWFIPFLALIIFIIGAIMVAFSRKSILTKILTVVLPVVLLYLAL